LTTKINKASAPTPRRRGRPKGSKGKATLFKEVMRQGFETALQKDFSKVLDVVISKAVDGDMVAAKMLLDRVVPAQKASDNSLADKGNLNIQITVGGMEEPKQIEGEVIESE